MEGFLNRLLDLLISRFSRRKDVQYLSTQLIMELDKFVSGCADVVADDGLHHGEPDESGCRRFQISPPEWGLATPAPDWKLLPTEIMHNLVQFPNDISSANDHISGASDHAFPPDYEEAFEERQYQYALLGLKAEKLARDLRENAKLPARKIDNWDPVKYLAEQQHEIESRRELRASANVKLFSKIAIESSESI